jgi:hypothetical protein
MRCFRISVLLALVFALHTTAAMARHKNENLQYVSPKLASGEEAIHSVCVVPGEMQLTKVGMKGKEGMEKQSEEWANALQGIVEALLKASEVEVVSSAISPDQLDTNPDAQQLVLQVQKSYDSVATQLEKHPKDIKKHRFSLGDEVAILPCSAKSDALVFFHAEGEVLTRGKKAFNLLVVTAPEEANLRLSFVDSKTGDVLTLVRIQREGDRFEKNPERAYGKALDREFKKIKIGEFTAVKKKKAASLKANYSAAG